VEILGWVLVVVGATVFVASVIRTVRANAGRTVPLFGAPPTIPPGTILLRLGGTAMLVVGAVLLVPQLGVPSVLFVAGGPIVAAGIVSLHNWRVRTSAR
jgi:hypothetical protein